MIAQRLIRRICSKCKHSYKPSMEEIKELGLSARLHRKSRFYRGKGCEACVGTGYQGRTGIYSLMELTTHVQNAVLKGEDAENIAVQAQQDPRFPMASMLDYGRQKILDGVTTVEEIMRVT